MKKRGISLIVLVITILVMIILSGVVIVSLSKNNPVERAKEATFKTDVSSFNGDLSLYLANGLANNSTLKMEDVNASGFENMKNVINSFTKKYAEKLEVVSGKLVYIGKDKKEKEWIKDLGITTKEGIVNEPVLADGMIPIKYSKDKWVICDSSDSEWYNYENKQWANVMLSDGKYKTKAVGTVVEDSDLGSMFVWIPRYAYSINKYKTAPTGTEGQTQEIHDITFLTGTSDSDVEGKTYGKSYDAKNAEVGKPTPKIVHPAFNFGGVEKQGIWVAKFEASMNEDGTGHTNQNSNASCDFADANHSMVKVLPGKPTWRYISVGPVFNNCFNMAKSGNIYRITNVDSHLIKNVEWGAVAYLTTSKYGSTPVINSNNNKEGTDTYNGYSSLAGGSNSYHDNRLQSTTGNETGIYDMNGGAWEYVGAFVDNKNEYLSKYAGNAIFNSSNTVNAVHEKYVDKYLPSPKEEDVSIQYTIWETKVVEHMYGNQYKKDIATDRLNLSSNKLGDAFYEITTEGGNGFFGIKTDGKYAWIKNLKTDVSESGKCITNYNTDYALIGQTYLPFTVRGGNWTGGRHSGIFAYGSACGDPHYTYGFRPVIVNN